MLVTIETLIKLLLDNTVKRDLGDPNKNIINILKPISFIDKTNFFL